MIEKGYFSLVLAEQAFKDSGNEIHVTLSTLNSSYYQFI